MYQSLQGNFGLGKAIEYFTSHSIPVSIPLNDTQKYDLVIDQNGQMKRVSVKTTRQKRHNCYCVELKNSGGASRKKTIRPFDNSSCDLLFVLTDANTTYLIPTERVDVRSSLTLNERFDDCIVLSKPFSNFMEE